MLTKFVVSGLATFFLNSTYLCLISLGNRNHKQLIGQEVQLNFATKNATKMSLFFTTSFLFLQGEIKFSWMQASLEPWKYRKQCSKCVLENNKCTHPKVASKLGKHFVKKNLFSELIWAKMRYQQTTNLQLSCMWSKVLICVCSHVALNPCLFQMLVFENDRDEESWAMESHQSFTSTEDFTC